MAAVLDSLVPGVQIGAFAEPVAERRHLAALPLFGYSDSTYAPTPQFRGVSLKVDEPLTWGERPSRAARIERVMLFLRSHADADPVLTMLTRKLGPPESSCYTPDKAKAELGGWALFFWPTDAQKGVLLQAPLDPSRWPAMLVFGTASPTLHPDFKTATPGRCASAP